VDRRQIDKNGGVTLYMCILSVIETQEQEKSGYLIRNNLYYLWRRAIFVNQITIITQNQRDSGYWWLDAILIISETEAKTPFIGDIHC